jgi:hypothetical protein
MTPKPNGDFTSTLTALRQGETLAALDAELAALTKAVTERKRPGTLTLTLKITPNARRGVRVLDDVVARPPKEDRAETFFYANAEGQLLRNDPDTPDLPGLVVVPTTQPAPITLSQQPASA